MEQKLSSLIHQALLDLYGKNGVSFVIEHPKELSHGDYATNVALIVSKQLDKSPREIAEAIAAYITEHRDKEIESCSVAGPGFINIILSRNYFAREVASAMAPDYAHNALYAGKRIMVEYTDPNPFKPFHIGHLMTNAIGESIARILDTSGVRVIRANYQGDIGPHVAKAIYGLMKKGMPDATAPISKQAQYIGECYVFGNAEYELTEGVQQEIDAINKKIYEKSDAEINKIYEWGREVTLQAFEEIYKILGTKFDYYFFESEMAARGAALVKEFLEKGIFEESEGAVVFRGEKYNPKLHTRVFITRQGLPTYETKELGLTFTKFEKEHLDQSVVVTADEQKDYMAVATEAVRQIEPALADRMKHITHGMMRFASGKMSSRKGNVVTGESLLEDAKERTIEKMKGREMSEDVREKITNQVSVAAIKYAILRQDISGNIIYDPEQSVSFEGDSGPYLQYTATRAGSVIAKATGLGIRASIGEAPENAYEIERVLYRFPEVVARAAQELQPHHITTYITDLASRFNSFYANEMIADPEDKYAPYKLALTVAVQMTLKRGLHLLGIETPEQM